MKLLSLLVPVAMSVLMANAQAADKAPSAAIDRITLIYMDHKIYPNGAVVCKPEVIGARSLIGCWNRTLDGKSSPHVWLYEANKFQSVNGSARQLAETKFSNEADVSVIKLPLPSDIDIGAALETFKKG